MKALHIILLFTSCFVFSQNSVYPYLDSDLDVTKRVDDLMNRMTLYEKACQMNQFVGLDHMKKAEKDLSPEDMKKSDAQGFYKGVFSEDVKQMIINGQIGSFLHVITAEEANYLQQLAYKSKLKIPLLIGIDAIHGNALYRGATVYPSPITIASTWDENNSYDVGIQTAFEMRSTGSHWAFTPNIDVMRDARWGRVGETFGEDPYLVTQMGTAMINGLQQGDFTGTNKVIACAKHLIAGSEPINGLNLSPMDISERTLNEIYLPPYKSAVDAGVFSIMAAHNEVNGVPSHSNKKLMTNIIRNEWGFDGFYVSDWLDIERLETLHKVAKNFKEAVYLAVDAGIDMHMHGPNFPELVVELVNEGVLSEERVNYACSKILEAKFKLGLFENRFVDEDDISEKIFNQHHAETALKLARQGIVLLKNNDVLPLRGAKNSKNKILVTGPNANNQSILGDWHSAQPHDNVYTVFEGIKKIGTEMGYLVDYHDSNENIKKVSEKDISKTIEIANEYDLVVLVVGDNSMRYKWNQKTAGENTARSELNLAGKQLELAMRLKDSGKNIIVVYVNGRPISEPWISENINAIIEAWEPGSYGGLAVAEIIFGKINPSGKLPLTVARTVGQLKMFYNHKHSMYFRDYAMQTNKPLYSFGFGLSYTKFDISKPKLNSSKFKKGVLSISVNVKNIGEITGDEIVQLYVSDKYSSITRPVKELKAYQRVTLKPGESKEIVFELNKSDFAYYDSDMNYVVEAGDFDILVGNSSRDEDLKNTNFNIEKTFYLGD
ncbi:MAG: beta-glucosidase [Flavobacteriaceae bacterium]|nr:beta-glucosidase [Flavobacteriaceae bacterium]|tara:strand:- start:9335 stop:11662 length:2328 start_codon:yes stop_codon:yes gene_type:complete